MAVVTGDDEQRAVSVSAPQQREMSGLTLLAGRPLGPAHYTDRNFYYFKPLALKTDTEHCISVYKYDIFIPKIVFRKIVTSNSNKVGSVFGHSVLLQLTTQTSEKQLDTNISLKLKQFKYLTAKPSILKL